MNNLVKTFVFLFFVFSSLFIKAQDLIVTNEGDSFKVFRIDVGKDAVYYQLEDNEDSPIHKVKKTDVLIIKLQDGTVVNLRDAENTSTNNNSETGITFLQEPVADPSIIASLEIGSLIEFYDGSKGIVFYLDGNGHGLAVSMSETPKITWQAVSSWRDCIDVESVPNNNTNFQMGLGATYCKAALSDLGPMNLPAIADCQSMGPGWYLPCIGEMNELIVVANQSQGRFGPISKAVEANGGESLHNFDYPYLTCSEIDNTDVYVISVKGEIFVTKKYKQCRCRAIRMF